MTLEIRDATEGDLQRLVALLAQLAPDDPSREDASLPGVYGAALQRIQATPGLRLLIAEDNGEIIGSLALCIVPNLSHVGKPWALVENVVVDESARGRGVGEALMRYAIEEARRTGCYRLSLMSNKRRTDAHRFYERLGFQRTHEAFRLNL